MNAGFDGRGYPEINLLNLAFEILQSSSSSLALSTWKNYAGSVQKTVTFTQEYGVICFSVLNERLADGCRNT